MIQPTPSTSECNSITPVSSPITIHVGPARVIRGSQILENSGRELAALGQRPLVIGGDRALSIIQPRLFTVLEEQGLTPQTASYLPDCSETSLETLRQAVADHQADFIIGVGGGKALDTAKLIAHQCHLAIATLPTSGATCAAWTALSNVYSNQGAFLYDVALDRCPDLLILDYDLILTAPKRTLVAGIGDAIAKWYEASVSSGHCEQTLIIAAVQQARVLRDILLQHSPQALQNPGSETWKQIVDACVLMAGVTGGLGGAQCRTVAAHAVHNGLTHIDPTHKTIHGEKVAYGILVQLRLEEMIQNNHLALSARQQLIQFYEQIGLPKTLEDLGLAEVTLAQLRQVAAIACAKSSDIHHLPFAVNPDQLVAAMVSTLN
ncbi:iron-containing alcohol dehydrogenase family protein [Roseofilum sp. BLCC_M154]|uniref:Iron-containing alcohol dehydrogenase family protein n=1 Tax=Roseofilum acuticapitatum BLCC-M154 TaxID=3022444 RepID=A0ABT7ASV5_9CYAN|nr:iron-containing alcohol dehydrogenase family protein [Roseofilum acuticapitatum]MDJ1169148.1 iron-containing alcohol dehydrogenase family protein [Roseofilum acuticapitatum BLCC-M154]